MQWDNYSKISTTVQYNPAIPALPPDSPAWPISNRSTITPNIPNSPVKGKSKKEIEKEIANRRLNELVKSISPRHYKRLCDCGLYMFPFQAQESSPHVFIRSGCHSDLCFICKKHDVRKQKRVIDYIGESIINCAVWIKIIITIPIEYRNKYFTDYDAIDTFINKSWDIIKTEYGIWHGLERYDRGGGILSMHWMGDKTTNYNPHLEVLIPAIKNGLPFEPKQNKDEFKQRKHRIRKRISKTLSSITGENVGIERTNARILFKRDTASKIHAIKYQVRNTINIDKVVELPKTVQKFLIDGRWGKKSVRYKGKLWGTEIKNWYSYLGLDYKNRNGGDNKNKWKDLEGNEYKYTGEKFTCSRFKSLGIKLLRLTSTSYCFKDQSIISKKASEILLNALKSSHKVAKGAIGYLKKSIGDDTKIDWDDSVIKFAKEMKFFHLIDPELASGKSKRRWGEIEITEVNRISKKAA